MYLINNPSELLKGLQIITKKIKLSCDDCRNGAYSNLWPPPKRIFVHEDGPTFLHRCEKCFTYWHFDLKGAVPISENKAKELYPLFFLRNGKKE